MPIRPGAGKFLCLRLVKSAELNLEVEVEVEVEPAPPPTDLLELSLIKNERLSLEAPLQDSI